MKDPDSPPGRPRRGSPEATRRRLIEAAAERFNANGLQRTSADEIARQAGYATGTFYKHFRHKHEALIAAYEAWVAMEWEALGREVLSDGVPQETARRVVELGAQLHIRWRGLRRAMSELVGADEAARRSYRQLQRRQLRIVKDLRRRRSEENRYAIESDALILMTMERVFDGIADGELRELGLSRKKLLDQLTAALAATLS